MSSFSTEIAVYFMSNKEMSYLIINVSLFYGVSPFDSVWYMTYEDVLIVIDVLTCHMFFTTDHLFFKTEII